VILGYDGKLAFGSILDMIKNYFKGHYLGEAGPLNEVFCAELVAMTYVKLGLMSPSHPPNFYSPSSFSKYSHDVVLLEGTLEPEVLFDVANHSDDVGAAPEQLNVPSATSNAAARCRDDRARRGPSAQTSRLGGRV